MDAKLYYDNPQQLVYPTPVMDPVISISLKSGHVGVWRPTEKSWIYPGI